MEPYGGETGIRTLGTREGSTVFETAPFDHSGTSPVAIYIFFRGYFAIQKMKQTYLSVVLFKT